MIPVEARVADVLDGAGRSLRDTPASSAIDALRTRLQEPMRVAIAGRVKSGKSTLLNALIGERLAATDASECTRIVTWYAYDDAYRVVALGADGDMHDVGFTRTEHRLVIDEAQLPLGADELRVGWPSRRLRAMTLIDTPGTGSLTPDVAGRAAAALHQGPEGRGVADAVVYLMRHMHATDVDFLEAFLGDESGQPTPVNSVAVLSRADEIGAGRLDAMASASRIAARYAADDRLRTLVSAVVAVSGLSAETAATLQEREAEALRMLLGEDAAVVDRMLLSVDLWRAPGAGPLSVDIRQELLDRLGMFGLRIAVEALRQGRWSTASDLARLLLEASGVPLLQQVLQQRFAGRSRQLVARSVLASLRSVVSALPPSPEATEILRRIEETESASHEFAELRLLELIWSSQVDFSDDERDEAERLTGSGTAARRVGCEPEATREAVREAAIDGATRWRARAGDAMVDPTMAMCCETMARSYEGVYLSTA